MRVDEKDFLLNIIDKKRVDFYLEDDMFEIEGLARKKDDEVTIEVLDAVGHMLEISGQYLKVIDKISRLNAERLDTGKIFEMEINRVYDQLIDPSPKDFMKMKELEVEEFFKKQTDTLVWFDYEENKWVIELNKINMYFSGDRYYYDSLEDLFKSHKDHMLGAWQALYYSSEVEET